MLFSDLEIALTAFNRHNGTHFPRLQRLHEQGGDFRRQSLNLSWTAPNLRLLQCSYNLPPPASMFSSVATFAFTDIVQYIPFPSCSSNKACGFMYTTR